LLPTVNSVSCTVGVVYHKLLCIFSEETWVELDEDEVRQSKLSSYKPPSQAPESGIRRL